MPGYDKTGPSGIGPMTGRGAGYCAGNAVPGNAPPLGRRGRGGPGRGAGGGRGRRNRFFVTGLPGWRRAEGAASPNPPMTQQQELNVLRGEAENFGQALDEIKNRIEQLESEASGKTPE